MGPFKIDFTKCSRFSIRIVILRFTLLPSCRGYQELLAVSAAIQTVLSTPVTVATALKGIQKTLGKALPFKVGRLFIVCNAGGAKI